MDPLPPSEEEIADSLHDLQSTDAWTRRKRIEYLRERGVREERITVVLRQLAITDPSDAVRAEAGEALATLGPGGPEAASPAEREPGVRGFLVRYQQQVWGFVGWFVLASLLAPFSFGLITTPATVICLIAFGLSKRRKGLAGGILLATSLNFVIALVRGLQFNAWCFMPFYIEI